MKIFTRPKWKKTRSQGLMSVLPACMERSLNRGEIPMCSLFSCQLSSLPGYLAAFCLVRAGLTKAWLLADCPLRTGLGWVGAQFWPSLLIYEFLLVVRFPHIHPVSSGPCRSELLSSETHAHTYIIRNTPCLPLTIPVGKQTNDV